MRKVYIVCLLLAGIFMFFSSCVKKTLYESTGKLLITIDWEDMEMDDMVKFVNIKIGDTIVIVEKGGQPDPVFLFPGDYEILAYNTVGGISVDGNVANIVANENGDISFLPYLSNFYSSSDNAAILVNGTTEINIKPEINTGNIVIYLVFEDCYFSFSSRTLSNLARSYNIKSQEEMNAENIVLSSIRDTIEINTFGTIGMNQVLYLETVRNDSTYVYEKDIGEEFINFNDNKSETKTISIIINAEDVEFRSM